MNKKIVVALAIIIIIAGNVVGEAMATQTQTQPAPESYWGYAILDGEPAPIGTLVTVEVHNTTEIVGSHPIQHLKGFWYLSIVFDKPETPEDEGAENGDPLTWKLNGINCSIPAPGIDIAESGKANDNFSLVASTLPEPTPTPSLPPPPTPGPPKPPVAVPEFNIFGLLALISALTIFLAISQKRKK